MELQVEKVFKAAPGNRRVLMATLEACRVPQTPRALDELMGALLETNRSVFDAVELRALLERYGALEYAPSNEELAARTAGAPGEEPPVEVDDDGNLVICTSGEGTWNLTAAGRAYLDGDPQARAAFDLLEREGYYRPVYGKLLQYVEQQPRSKAQIDCEIDAHPLLQEPRMFAGHFVGELENVGALVWNGMWEITELGRALAHDLSDETMGWN